MSDGSNTTPTTPKPTVNKPAPNKPISTAPPKQPANDAGIIKMLEVLNNISTAVDKGNKDRFDLANVNMGIINNRLDVMEKKALEQQQEVLRTVESLRAQVTMISSSLVGGTKPVKKATKSISQAAEGGATSSPQSKASTKKGPRFPDKSAWIRQHFRDSEAFRNTYYTEKIIALHHEADSTLLSKKKGEPLLNAQANFMWNYVSNNDVEGAAAAISKLYEQAKAIHNGAPAAPAVAQETQETGEPDTEDE